MAAPSPGPPLTSPVPNPIVPTQSTADTSAAVTPETPAAVATPVASPHIPAVQATAELAAAPEAVQSWTAEQDKLFEKALAQYDQDTPTRWENVAAMVVGKDAEEVRIHYDLLLQDVTAIEAGRISLPSYNSSALPTFDGAGDQSDSSVQKKAVWAGQSPGVTANGSNGGVNGGLERKSSNSKADQERRKGIPWTEEEHRSVHFLCSKFPFVIPFMFNVDAFFYWACIQ